MSKPMSFEDWSKKVGYLHPPFGSLVHQGWQARQPEIDAIKADLERERLRLAACRVVAMSNTDESLAKALEMKPEYVSDSVRCVESAVRREMQWRNEVDALKAAAEKLTNGTVQQAMEIAELKAELAKAHEAMDVAFQLGAKFKENIAIKIDAAVDKAMKGKS